jgi:DNA-binding GntR family transcriptional regulator
MEPVAGPAFGRHRAEGMRMGMPTTDVAPIEPVLNLRNRVEQAIAAAIISGEMPPGQVYSAPQLAARFAVSATPVREAMLNLEKRGFVETLRNKGFRVTEVSERDLREIAEVRLMLEPPAMRRLAERFPQEHMAELRELAERIVATAREGDLGSYLEADSAFHLRLLSILGNRRLRQIVADLRSRTRLVGLVALIDTEELNQSAAEHQVLLDLLAAGKGEQAESATARHIGHVLGWWAGRQEDPGAPQPGAASARD